MIPALCQTPVVAFGIGVNIVRILALRPGRPLVARDLGSEGRLPSCRLSFQVKAHNLVEEPILCLTDKGQTVDLEGP